MAPLKSLLHNFSYRLSLFICITYPTIIFSSFYTFNSSSQSLIVSTMMLVILSYSFALRIFYSSFVQKLLYIFYFFRLKEIIFHCIYDANISKGLPNSSYHTIIHSKLIFDLSYKNFSQCYILHFLKITISTSNSLYV